MHDPLNKNERIFAILIMRSAVFIGWVSMLAFVIFIFNGPFVRNPMDASIGWLGWDIMLSLLFFIQHSSMVRRGLRTRFAGRIPRYYHDAIYCLTSAFVLALVIVYWQPSGHTVIALQGPWRLLARGIFFMAAVGTAWGAMALKAFDPYGKGPILARLTGRPMRSQPFSIQGPYRWVRHPLYFFVLVMIWTCPDLTADRLLFNTLWSGWVYIGALLEEKDLRNQFGEAYAMYQRRVPMLIPWKGQLKREKSINQGG